MDMTGQRVENRVNLFIKLVSRFLAVFVWRGRAEPEIGGFGLMLFYFQDLDGQSVAVASGQTWAEEGVP